MTSNNLHAASSQWAKRPSDQRFWTLRDLKGACEASREGSGTATVAFSALKAANVGDDVLVTDPTGTPAKLTHYAFGQLATSIGAPASYLRELPPVLAADCLNVGIARNADKSPRDLLFHKNGGLTLRACLSNQYERVWDSEVVKYLEDLDGWSPPAGRAPPGYRGETRLATAQDILPGQINISTGDSIAPSGLYASDHDMFAFLVAPDRVISDGAGGSLMRGMFVRNSEVGDSALTFTFFMMQAVCGNHIVWGASGVHEVRVRHVGKNPMRRALREFQAELLRYADGAAEEEKGIMMARKLTLGATKEEVLTALVKYAKTHSLPLSKARLSDAYDVAEKHTDWYGPPNTLWGTVAGLTQSSQSIQFADERAAVDRAAGRLMAMAF
jgi:Domain of unknown function (DUF932)